jgi:hypothetical protein
LQVEQAGNTGKNPTLSLKKCIAIAKKYKNVEILWASV